MLFCRVFENVINRVFLVLIFWGGKLVGANFYAFCNYVLRSTWGWVPVRGLGCVTRYQIQNDRKIEKCISLEGGMLSGVFSEKHLKKGACQGCVTKYHQQVLTNKSCNNEYILTITEMYAGSKHAFMIFYTFQLIVGNAF